MNEIMKNDAGEIGATVKELLTPVMSAMAEFMRQSTEALNKIALQQKIQSDRLEALERQMRLSTPVTKVQGKYINDAIRERARLLLENGDKQQVNKLAAVIRKYLLTRYGVGCISEIPKCEYEVAMKAVEMWNDRGIVRKVRSGE